MVRKRRYLVIRCVGLDVNDFLTTFLERYMIWIPVPERFDYPAIEAIFEIMVIVSVDKSVVRSVRALLATIHGCYTVRCLGTLRRAKRMALTIRHEPDKRL